MARPPRKPKQNADAAREVELKLLLEPDAVAILKTLPVIGPALAKARASKLAATYYDTPDSRLEKAGLTLRLRSEAKKNILTVKTIESARSIAANGRSRSRARGSSPATSPPRPPLPCLGKNIRDLKPLFTTNVERAKAMIAYKSASVELALDRGMIEARKRKLPISNSNLN